MRNIFKAAMIGISLTSTTLSATTAMAENKVIDSIYSDLGKIAQLPAFNNREPQFKNIHNIPNFMNRSFFFAMNDIGGGRYRTNPEIKKKLSLCASHQGTKIIGGYTFTHMYQKALASTDGSFTSQNCEAFYQDFYDSINIVERAYTSLQEYIKGDEFKAIAQDLIDTGYKGEHRKLMAFTNLIKDGNFNNDFKAKVNLTVCAGFSMFNLSKIAEPRPSTPVWNFFQKSLETLDLMAQATEGKSWKQSNCQYVYGTYKHR